MIQVNWQKIIIGMVFIAISIFSIRYALTRPCEIEPITQTVGDQVATVDQPEQMNRMICLSTDTGAIIPLLIGTATIFPGMSGLYRGLTESKKDSKE